MASDLVKHVTDATFEADVLQSVQPILVDYWAEWCGPCKMIAPILDEVSVAYEGKLQIAKMNVDENREIPAKFGIRGIPTLMLFKDGKLAATKVGALSKSRGVLPIQVRQTKQVRPVCFCPQISCHNYLVHSSSSDGHPKPVTNADASELPPAFRPSPDFPLIFCHPRNFGQPPPRETFHALKRTQGTACVRSPETSRRA